MEKISWKPGTMIYPLPAVMVSCGDSPENYNIITVAWTGTVCSSPAKCYISIRPERHSYEIIKRTGEFVINLTTKQLAKATDWCGVKSGKDFNKFEKMNLTPVAGEKVKSPVISESPLNIECKVEQIIPMGSHDMFLAEVVHVQADAQYMDSKTGRFELEEAGLLVYSHGHYYTMGEQLGKFGFSVQKKSKKGQHRKGSRPQKDQTK